MTNPFNLYFQRADDLVPKLEAGSLTDAERLEVVDLFRRGLFFIAGHLNQQAHLAPHIILEPDPEVVQGEVNGTDTPSVDQPESHAG